MHRFLRSIGFSTIHRRRDIKTLLDRIPLSEAKTRMIHLDDETGLCEVRLPAAEDMGLVVVGEIGLDGDFEQFYYYPYLAGHDCSSMAECSLQRHADKETYAGLLDENRVGLSLIFFVNNSFECLERDYYDKRSYVSSVNLTGLSTDGKVLLPIQHTQQEIDDAKISAANHNSLVEAARNGDQNAIEVLTIEDIDLYSQISRRVMDEDIYSMVDSTFMPSGVECDQYAILGTITSVQEKINCLTGETVYDLGLDCNDILFNVGISKRDLMGQPEPGRRFKGTIWMQGVANFADEE